jgi:N-hydroxyarylamine O-acetyltransferase
MFSVPFENLDIPLGVKIDLDLERIYRKVVEDGRGGFCYELNGLFGWLLTEIGFDVEMLSARVFGSNEEPGPEFDHLLLRVNGEYLADVGFGDSFLEPLENDTGEQTQEMGTYRITVDNETSLMERKEEGLWKSQYLFTSISRAFSDFDAMCTFQQTSPDSIFTQKTVCSMATPEGRVTYSNGRLIETKHRLKSEKLIASADDLESTLKDIFGIELSHGCNRLFQAPAGKSV